MGYLAVADVFLYDDMSPGGLQLVFVGQGRFGILHERHPVEGIYGIGVLIVRRSCGAVVVLRLVRYCDG